MANGDILAIRVTGTSPLNGFVGEIDIENLATGGSYNFNLGTNNDPSAAYFVLTVTSPAYSENSSTPTTSTRTVYGTPSLQARGQRKVYPNNTAPDESTSGSTLTIKIDLSDQIYAGDTVTAVVQPGLYTQGATPSSAFSGSVTNNSTLTWDLSKVVGDFMVEDRRPVNGSELLEVFVISKYAKNNKPVAGLWYAATGQTSGTIKNGWGVCQKSTRGDNLPVYALPLDLSVSGGFTMGEVVVVNFTAYPWFGDTAAILDATTDAGSTLYALAPLNWTIADKVIAVIDWIGGGTPQASTSQATADLHPFATIMAGVNAAYTANGNKLDGVEIQLKANNNIAWAISGASQTTNGYITFKPHSSTNRAGVVFTSGQTNYNFFKFHRFLDITISRAGAGYFGFNHANEQLIMQGVNFDDAQGAWYDGDGNNNCVILDSVSNNTNFFNGPSTAHFRLLRNNVCNTVTQGGRVLINNATNCATMLATGTSTGFYLANSSGALRNILLAYNEIYAISGNTYAVDMQLLDVEHASIVGNIFERIGASSTPLMEISDANMKNIGLFQNSLPGQRVNVENDITASYVNKTAQGYSMKFNIFNARGNHQADVYDTDPSMTGAWSFDNSVGCEGNWNEAISYSGQQDQYGINSNTPALGGLTYIGTFPAGYINDQSQGGGNAGNGDYRLDIGAAARAIRIPVGRAMLLNDLRGNPIPNNGTGLVGALQDEPTSAGSAWWWGN